jgi:hypothetical protein
MKSHRTPVKRRAGEARQSTTRMKAENGKLKAEFRFQFS